MQELPDCLYEGKQPTLITPSSHTPNHSLYLSNLDDHHFLRFSIKYIYLFQKSVSSLTLKDSLSRVLVDYYPFAGRIKVSDDRTKLEVDCNGEGAVFAEAFMDITCQEFLELSPKPNKSWRKLLFKVQAAGFLDIPPLVIQNITMGEEHPRKRSRQHFEAETRHVSLLESPQCETSKWYFSREEIERFSPSRKDGIDMVKESFLRSSYCTFLQRLGMKLHVSQVAIGCAMVMCHRFYMRQSHAKNDWQTIATASLFLACKAEDEPCQLSSVVVASYEIIYEWDPSASIRIHQTEYYHEFKEFILAGERLLLDTSAFHHLDIELPYKPLAAALSRLNAWSDLATASWNFVHDWLRTTLCLQYKPHVIATATVHLAATFQNAKVGSRRDWWLDFGVTTKLLKEVIQEMCMLIEVDRRRAIPPPRREVAWAIPAAIKPPVHMARGYPFHSYALQSYRQPGIW